MFNKVKLHEEMIGSCQNLLKDSYLVMLEATGSSIFELAFTDSEKKDEKYLAIIKNMLKI